VKVAVTVALLLVLAACAALAYAVLHNPAKPKAAAPPPPSPSPTASASPSQSLGPYGHIASRSGDPAPLTVGQLFPASFTAGTATIMRTVGHSGPKCSSAVVGSKLQSAVSSAGCTQAVRATYLSRSQNLMGTIGVLNLRSANAAKTAARAAGPSNFISQLKSHSGPTRKIGLGTGIEEAAAKGHYLILIWAENTNLRKPKTAAQRSALERFMTELLDQTANVSLSTRMLTGSP
jgi:hypothetical protein